MFSIGFSLFFIGWSSINGPCSSIFHMFFHHQDGISVEKKQNWLVEGWLMGWIQPLGEWFWEWFWTRGSSAMAMTMMYTSVGGYEAGVLEMFSSIDGFSHGNQPSSELGFFPPWLWKPPHLQPPRNIFRIVQPFLLGIPFAINLWCATWGYKSQVCALHVDGVQEKWGRRISIRCGASVEPWLMLWRKKHQSLGMFVFPQGLMVEHSVAPSFL